MKNRLTTVLMLLVLLVSLTGNARATSSTSPDLKALIHVELRSPGDLSRFASTRLPMFSLLEGGLLTGADLKDQQGLDAAGLSFQVLDPDLRAGTYYLAQTRSSRPAPEFALYGQVLLSTSSGVLLRMDPAKVNALTQAGAELKQITLTPKPLPATQGSEVNPAAVEPDPLIQVMVDQVTTNQVSQYDRELAGEIPVWVDGGWYTISSRYTYSGTPIEKTMHYVGQHMAGLGMDIEYHQWGGATYPNVIAEMPGLTNPEDIFIIGAHIDDVQGTPGADDNASGSVATLLAADIMSQFDWGCTLRFALWTGEEQGLNGSHAYAQRSYNNGENILGYLNLDMIAWNTIGSQPGIDIIYNPNMPQTQVFAQLFADSVGAYDLNLVPQLVTDLGGGSDHSSFWDFGYNSILSIEDQGDFNPYYHGPGDTPAHTDLAFFTNFVKASIATLAHKSNCLIPNGLGSMDGHVTAASGGAPIEGATVLVEDGTGHTFSSTTDASGYYTRTLMSGTYDVTASAYGYLPASVSGVEVITDTITTLDFSLIDAPTYVVSGTVTESITGLPLLADISFEGSPVTATTDPNTGFYSAVLPQGEYTMQVRSTNHLGQTRSIVVEANQTQNFVLDPLPCILLVDDDQDGPDVREAYTGALDDLGYGYNLWDVSTGGNPGATDLAGYQQVIWFNGYPYAGTFTEENETAVGAYLDAGGNFFLSSQDYLYDVGLTSFAQDYLHISSFSSDVSQTTITGQNVYSGLGPYTLSYPFTNYSDRVIPDAQAQVAFNGNAGNAAVSFDGQAFNTVFFGYPFEAIASSTDRSDVMERTVNFLGGCQDENGVLEGHVTDADSGSPLEGVSVTAAPGLAGIQSITDPSGYYSMTLPAGTYMVTAALDGYVTQSQSATVGSGIPTTLDFALTPACEPVSGLDFTWEPASPFSGDLLTFTATASGSEPIDFQWDFGDTYTATGSIVNHVYNAPNAYQVELSATNACSTELVSKELTVVQKLWQFFLPFVSKDQ